MKDLLRCITLIVALSCCWCSSMALKYKVVSDVDYTTKTDSYACDRCKLDISFPKDTVGCPVVVWFHGGGLTSGSKQLPGRLTNIGMVVVGVNYRLLPKVTVDECLDDCAEAMAWVFRNIDKYGGDPSKIFVSGHSAGGYITAMLGLDKSWLAKYDIDADKIAGLIPFSGQAISHFSYRKMNGIPNLQPTIDKYAPLFHVRPDAPPLVLITGDRELELFGRYEENAYLWRMMKLVGHKQTYLYEIGGHDHGGMGEPSYSILKRHLKNILAEREQQANMAENF